MYYENYFSDKVVCVVRTLLLRSGTNAVCCSLFSNLNIIGNLILGDLRIVACDMIFFFTAVLNVNIQISHKSNKMNTKLNDKLVAHHKLLLFGYL